MLRELMREMAPNVNELIAYGLPMWKGNKIFAYISPTKKNIAFGFTHGVEFKDEYRLLRGVGKATKHVKVKRLEESNNDALKYYIKQAIEFDSKNIKKNKAQSRI